MATEKKPPKRVTNRDSEDVSSTRRRLLTGSVVTGLTLPVLPGKWSRPVVQSVLLPAHAQSSPPCPTTATIEGCSFRCDDTSPHPDTRHRISVSEEGCIVVEPASDLGDDVVRIYCQVFSGTDGDVIEANIGIGGIPPTNRSNLVTNCSDCDPQETTFGPVQVAGGQAQVTADVSITCGDNPTASVSNIVVTLI